MAPDELGEPPLRRPVFHILLALSREPLHGLGIADEASRVSGGAVELGPGTLYRSLKEMLEADLVAEVPTPSGADPRRRYYRITSRGRALLTAEVARMEALVDVARERDVLPGTT